MNPHIQVLLDEVWSQLKSVYTKEKNRIDDIKKHSPLQAGFRDYVKVGYHRATSNYKQGSFFVEIEEPFSWSDTAYTWESEVDRDQLNDELLQNEFLPAFQKRMHTLFLSDEYGTRFFNYRLELWLEFEYEQSDNRFLYTEKWINTAKQTALQQALQQFIEEKVSSDGSMLPEERDLFFFANLMLNKDIISTDVQTIASLFERLDVKLLASRPLHDGWQSTSNLALRHWADEFFLPMFFDAENEYTTNLHLKPEDQRATVEPDDMELFIYLALRIGKNDAERRKTYLEYAAQLHSEIAQRYLRQGSGNTESERKNSLLHGKANDILQTIEIKLLAEEEENYREALTYICDLLREGFPHEYQLKCSSKQKNFLPVKGLAKSPLHRFFANALQYPNLYPLIAEYGELSLQEYAWYNDVEPGEKSVTPGTYAIFGLGLFSTDYFPLLIKYMRLVDTEHQSAQDHYAEAFVHAHGMTVENIPVLMPIVLAGGESAKPIKGWADYLDQPEFILIWDKQLQPLEDYQRNHILYRLCGSASKQKAFIQKAEQLRHSHH